MAVWCCNRLAIIRWNYEDFLVPVSIQQMAIHVMFFRQSGVIYIFVAETFTNTKRNSAPDSILLAISDCALYHCRNAWFAHIATLGT
jgi:hypothetical protein